MICSTTCPLKKMARSFQRRSQSPLTPLLTALWMLERWRTLLESTAWHVSGTSFPACVPSSLTAQAKTNSPSQLSSVLFMARLCQSMGELCPSLKQCILGKQGGLDPVSRGTPRQGKKLGKGNTAKAADVSPAQSKWSCLKEELLSCSMEAYGIWSSALTRVR